MKQTGSPARLGPEVLRGLRLPQPSEESDKEGRGRVLVVGGSREMPGAVILAAEAALRAGAGKVQIATAETVAAHVAAAVPEARVFSLPETKAGSVGGGAVRRLEKYLGEAQSILLGPGWAEERAVARFVTGALPFCVGASVVLDAGAIEACLGGGERLLHPLGGRAVVTPNADETAGVTGGSAGTATRDPLAAALEAAARLRAVVVMKGRETFVAGPEGRAYSNLAGNVGLATSGSGDVLAGAIAGLLARGAEPLAAAAWGVHLHALAGDRLAARVGRLGFLARELPAEFPRLLTELGGCREKRRES